MNIRAVAVDEATRIKQIIDDCRVLEGPMLPILHGIQHEFGFVPESATALIAEALNLSRAEVHGVISFYHDFRKEPSGRHVLRLCRAEACQATGCDRIAEKAKAILGIDWHQTTPDGAVTLEPVFCLGLCASGPAAMLDADLHGCLDEASLRELLAEARQ